LGFGAGCCLTLKGTRQPSRRCARLVRMRISRTPGPTSDIGFQSVGSRPCCTRQNSNPARDLASVGRARTAWRESPTQTTGLSPCVRASNVIAPCASG
jgi:hypothetical protein